MANDSLAIPLTTLASRGDNENDALIVPRSSDNVLGEATRAMNGVDIGLTDVDEDDVLVVPKPRATPEGRNSKAEELDSPDFGLDPGLTDINPNGDAGNGEGVEPRHRPPTENRGKFPQYPFAGYPQPHGLYAVKKNIAQGMMDVALLTANASQLRYVLRSEAFNVYYYLSIVLISISLVLQIIVGFALVMNNYAEQSGVDRARRAKRINNVVVALIFLITVVNVFIASFGVEDVRSHRPVTFQPQKDCRELL